MDVMSSMVWSKLPLEVLCTSEVFYDLASDLLWETLKVDPEQLATYRNVRYIK